MDISTERELLSIIRGLGEALLSLQGQAERVHRILVLQMKIIGILAGESPEDSEPRRQAQKEIERLERLFRLDAPDQGPDDAPDQGDEKT